MEIGLIDVDGHKYPNLALMKISAHHKSKGDNVEWYSPFHGTYDTVYMSKVFSFSKDYPYVVDSHKVIRGGGRGMLLNFRKVWKFIIKMLTLICLMR